jgi:hypothetical protein
MSRRRDGGRYQTFYHLSPHGDIGVLRGRRSRVFGEKGLFANPSYGTLVEDWLGHVASRKSRKRKEQGQPVQEQYWYATFTVYRLGLPRDVMEDYESQFRERRSRETGGDPLAWFRFWA